MPFYIRDIGILEERVISLIYMVVKVIKPNVDRKDIGMLGSMMTNLHSLTT